jgi:hypothetical protein
VAQSRDQQYRRRVAELAVRVWAGELPFLELLEQIGGHADLYATGDQTVDEIIDFLEHQPGDPTERDRRELQRLIIALWE